MLIFPRRISKALKALFNLRTCRALLRYRVAPSFEHEAMLRSLPKLGTVVDIGAHSGQFALLSRLVHPQACIHSFEPVAASSDLYDAVMKGAPEVTLHRVAIGRHACDMQINLHSRSDSSSLLRAKLQTEAQPGSHECGTQTVRVCRLREALAGEKELSGPALLKIDVQGYEGHVLEGCEDMLHVFDWILCEMSFIELYEGQCGASELIAWLKERDFELAGVGLDPAMIWNGRHAQADFLLHKAA